MMLRVLALCLRRSALGLAALPLLVAAQGINIQTPQLPPRGQAAAAQPPPKTSQPQTGYGQQTDYGNQAPSQTGYGQQPSGPQPTYGTQPAVSGQAPQSPGSPLRQGGAAAGSFGQGHAQAPGAGGTAPQVTMVAPTPSAPGGNCRAKPSPDRQTLSLLGPDGQPRRHVPLGEFRVQLVVHSPDGLWAIALTKLRGEPQFAAMTVDLTRCETTDTVDLPAAGEDVRFEGDSAVVRMARGEWRVRLANRRER